MSAYKVLIAIFLVSLFHVITTVDAMEEKRELLEWSMPTETEPLIIHIPAEATFAEFVSVKDGQEPTGFCIDVFKKAVALLKYDLPYRFEPFHGLYDQLVDKVREDNSSAAVGDITILADRANHVEFTQPYMESRLTLVVPVKSGSKAWLIVRPFKTSLWLVLSLVCLYTMFAVWFLEHKSNPDFRGPWWAQLSSTVWFTCSSIFFVQSDRLRSTFTRAMMIVWFFTVFVVTSTYVASLTSMLTVERLEPTVDNIDKLRSDNSPVGYSSNSFIRDYLVNVLHFNPDRIIGISPEVDYAKALKNETIKAAFLEYPYERVFLSKNTKGYKDVQVGHRFGGFGFAFPKGSPFARDFSIAFLKLSEIGTLETFDRKWFKTFSQCPGPDVNTTLNLDSFWPLLLATSITSTIVILLFGITRPEQAMEPSFNSAEIEMRIKELARCFQVRNGHHLHDIHPEDEPTPSQTLHTISVVPEDHLAFRQTNVTPSSSSIIGAPILENKMQSSKKLSRCYSVL